MVGVPLAVALKHRTGLLKLAETGSMEPHHRTAVEFRQLLAPVMPPVEHQPRIAMAASRSHMHAKAVKPDPYGIQPPHNTNRKN